MKINRMDKRLLEINQIKDIISIDYKDIYYDGNQEKRHIMPGFLVFYGDLKSIFLTISDPFFEEFVRKIREVYLEEKDYVSNGIIKDKKIKINSLTESILLNGNLDTISSLYKFYDGKESYSESLLFEYEKLASFFPIIEYHLRNTMLTFDRTLGEIKLSEGINGTYYLKATLDNQTVLLPLLFETNDNDYYITIGNLLDTTLPLKMHIQFKDCSISVITSDTEHKINDVTEYTYRNNLLKERHLTVYRDEIVRESEQELPKEEHSSNLVSLDNDLENPIWFKLPWGSFLGLWEKVEYINEDGDITDKETERRFSNKRMVYLQELNDSFYVKELFSKRYICNSKDIHNNKDVVLDYLNKKIIGIKKDLGYGIETSFSGPGRTGYYTNKLEDKYYYHMSLETDLSRIDKSNLMALSKTNGLAEKVDLISLRRIRKK